MAYYDWALSGVLWLVVSGFADAILRGTGQAAVYFGERVGAVVATTAAVYAAFVGILFGILACGWAIEQISTHFIGAFPLGFSWGPDPYGPVGSLFNANAPFGVRWGDSGADSGPVTAPRSNNATRVLARLTCHARSVWLLGLSAHAAHPSPFAGKRVKPATLMRDDWFIQSGQRVCDPKFPLVAELRPHHRLTYAAAQEANRRPTVGYRIRSVPASSGVDASRNALYVLNRGGSPSKRAKSPLGETVGEDGHRPWGDLVWKPPGYQVRRNPGFRIRFSTFCERCTQRYPAR